MKAKGRKVARNQISRRRSSPGRLRAAHALAETPEGPGAAPALAAQVARFLADPAAAQVTAAAAAQLAQDQAGLPGRLATSLLPLIRTTR